MRLPIVLRRILSGSPVSHVEWYFTLREYVPEQLSFVVPFNRRSPPAGDLFGNLAEEKPCMTIPAIEQYRNACWRS